MSVFDHSLHDQFKWSSFIVHDNFVFIYHEKEGWLKILIGKPGGMNGQIVARKTVKDEVKSASCMMLNGKLYVRHEGHQKSDDKPARAFAILNKDTLEELPYEGEVHTTTLEDGTTRSLHWVEAGAKGGRALAQSPLLTDGSNVYVVSRRLPTAADREAAGSEAVTTLWLEKYTGPEDNFKFVSEVRLNKNVLGERLLKDSNSKEWLSNTSWACDGKYLLLFTKDCQVRHFSLKTGNKLAKLTRKMKFENNADCGSEPGPIYFCDRTSTFFMWHSKKQNQVCTIARWTQPGFVATGPKAAGSAINQQDVIA